MSTNQFNRQYPREIVVDLSIANIGTGNGVTAKLPQGALLVALTFLTVTAFDSATTSTGTVTDGTTVFVNAVDTKTAGSETVANVPKFYPDGGTLQFNLAETGATATVGRVVARAQYVLVNGGDEIMG